MPGIFPNIESGGVVVRDGAGVCINPPGVANAYCPPVGFTTSCQITALPEDCTARITPAQINALASELLCLAVTLDPDGDWDCDGVCNLATAFGNWSVAVLPESIVTEICATPAAIAALAACLVSADAPNVLSIGTDFKLKVDINTDGTIITGEGTPGSPITINLANMISGITTSAVLKNQLATGLLSATANNGISINANGLYFDSTFYVPATRQVATQHSLTGGGTLAANRTLNLVGDVASPGNNMFYGTNGAGTRGWYATATSSFSSAQQVITAGGALVLAHGLGVKPTQYEAYIVCTVAEFGYSIGDELVVNPSLNNNDATGGRGVSLVPDATNINVRFGNNANTFGAIRKDTGATINPTNANWRLIIRARP